MRIEYYRLYLKNERGIYQKPKIIKTKDKLLKAIQGLADNSYMIIGYDIDNNEDKIINYKECQVELKDNIKSKYEVKTYTFKPNELEKPSKRNRARRKREFDKEIENYLGR